MITIKDFASSYLKDNGNTGFTGSLVIVNRKHMVEDTIVENATTGTIVTIQKWFAFEELDDDQMLVLLHKSNGKTWYKKMINRFQDSNWYELD